VREGTARGGIIAERNKNIDSKRRPPKAAFVGENGFVGVAVGTKETPAGVGTRPLGVEVCACGVRTSPVAL
jgi:hypothetical protein